MVLEFIVAELSEPFQYEIGLWSRHEQTVAVAKVTCLRSVWINEDVLLWAMSLA